MSPEITYPLYVALAFYVVVAALVAVGLFCLFRALVRAVLNAMAPRLRQEREASGTNPSDLAPEPGKA